MNKVKLIVDRKNLTVEFKCEGDIWKWLHKVKDTQDHYDILNYVRYPETKKFYYEMYLDKFIRRFRDCKIEIVEA